MAEILETPFPSRTLHWPDEAATALAAQRWAELLRQHPAHFAALITLEGPLGAGKTTFVRHLLRALGVEGRIKSPSYAVLESHALPDGREAHHFDFFRFSDPREWEDAGFRELLAGPELKLCEWPSHAQALLPVADLQLQLAPDEDQLEARTVRATAGSARGAALLASWP